MNDKVESFNDRFFKGRGTRVSARYAAMVSSRCAKCDAVALRRVGVKGYCKAHFAEAMAHRRKVRASSEASALRNGTDFTGES